MEVFQIANLRLGFGKIPPSQFKDIRSYIQYLIDHPVKFSKPEFIEDETLVFENRKLKKKLSDIEKKQQQKEDRNRFKKLQLWWIEKMYNTPNPLQEKMVLFWHNHFVSSYQKVKETTFIYNQNNLFRKHAFGNFTELTKEILYDNAMIIYLDNKQNKAIVPNENLSRELLELFTLGIGNYSEVDIKEGARALAGLRENINGGMYEARFEDNGYKIYLGKKGNLKADDLIKAIFNHPRAAHLITEKLLKFFLSDEPNSILIEKYAQFLRNSNFEIKPFLIKLFTEIDFLAYNGDKIKSPMEFLLQSYAQFNYTQIPTKATLSFLKNQGMEILNPPNVKGWTGGQAWLNSGKLIARNTAIDMMLNNRFVQQPQMKMVGMDNLDKDDEDQNMSNNNPMILNLASKTGKEVVKELSDRLIYEVDEDMQINMQRIIDHDFNLSDPSAEEYVKQLTRYLMKSPQYQIL